MRTNIEVLKIAEYKGITILIRAINDHIEYIFQYRGKFYHAHNIFRFPLLRFPKKYTFNEKQNGANLVLSQAEASIDILLKTK